MAEGFIEAAEVVDIDDQHRTREARNRGGAANSGVEPVEQQMPIGEARELVGCGLPRNTFVGFAKDDVYEPDGQYAVARRHAKVSARTAPNR